MKVLTKWCFHCMRVARLRKVSDAFAVNCIRIRGMAALQDEVSD
jgi:hypothetical protein